MPQEKLPFTREQIAEIAKTHPTPFHIYDEQGIIENLDRFQKAFSWADFKEYYAVKAAPNPYLMKLLQKKNVGFDCSSLAELELSERVGSVGEEIMFTSNDTPAGEFKRAAELGAIINFDDISHLDYYENTVGKLPDLVCFRYNPGELKSGNDIIGNPTDAKYGFTREQLFEGFAACRDKGITRFGLHTMVASNELDEQYFVETARLLFEVIGELTESLGITFEFVNLGGGIGIPYTPEERPVNLETVGEGIRKEYETLITGKGLSPLKIYMECGRMITGPYGYLVTKVRHIKNTYKTFVGVDATMANLMRPGMYEAYHHITVLGKETAEATEVYDVAGSLCENNDKFALDRKLPPIERGDFLAIHDAGAHGHAMGFNYNGKLRSAELLLRSDGSVVHIRRAETLNDLFATLDFTSISEFK
ncbi:diaminopimelate decarboxylase family protein [Chitinivibrio alkaliphilus]|uniref:Diaminopimelate decarboxylase n=1 Tax=Chitinivibrio alkaliphilus ACht1 TaxID=1313304 RepID=U7DA78_9BACT|nr:diaminopimelate decarboxylase [Chitinivibrio alkaliphilus]ERP39294.1 diaminopimelate decarboxylase [Chitinivibrio alkaliphilus ACht1]